MTCTDEHGDEHDEDEGPEVTSADIKRAFVQAALLTTLLRALKKDESSPSVRVPIDSSGGPGSQDSATSAKPEPFSQEHAMRAARGSPPPESAPAVQSTGDPETRGGGHMSLDAPGCRRIDPFATCDESSLPRSSGVVAFYGGLCDPHGTTDPATGRAWRCGSWLCPQCAPRPRWLSALLVRAWAGARLRALSWFFRRITPRVNSNSRGEWVASPPGGEAASPRSDSGAGSTTREGRGPEALRSQWLKPIKTDGPEWIDQDCIGCGTSLVQRWARRCRECGSYSCLECSVCVPCHWGIDPEVVRARQLASIDARRKEWISGEPPQDPTFGHPTIGERTPIVIQSDCGVVPEATARMLFGDQLVDAGFTFEIKPPIYLERRKPT